MLSTMKYVALLRGINVGGNNKISMPELKRCLEDLGYSHVSTYINSGNIFFESGHPAAKVANSIEASLLEKFPGTTVPIKVLVLSKEQVAKIVNQAPKGYGQQPDKYRYDVIYMIGKPVSEAMAEIELHPEVDRVWAGETVIYYQRLIAKITKSRVNKIVGKPIYRFMTLRNWNTTKKLLELIAS